MPEPASLLRIAHRLFGRLAVPGLVLCALALAACGGEEQQPVVQEPPPVDPRYASAEALIEHFNALNSDPGTGLRTELDLYYAENNLQKRIINALEYMVYAHELNEASRQQFGEPFDPSFELYPESANLTSNDGRRAVARATIIATGEQRDLHLVELEGRWWLSGYTFEYDEDFNDPEGIAFLEEMSKGAREAIPPIIARIKAGEFETVDEARGAVLVEAMKELSAQQGADR